MIEMPDRVFQGFRQPPTLSDRLVAHLAEVGIALLGVLRGVQTLLSDGHPFVTPPTDLLPSAVSIPIGLLLTSGGFLWFYATGKRFKTINAYWYIFRWATSLSAFGWTAMLVATLGLRPASLVSWSTALVFSLVAWGLYGLSFVREAMVRKRG